MESTRTPGGRDDGVALTRRAFLSALGASVGAISVASAASFASSCSSATEANGAQRFGFVRGTVVDGNGLPQIVGRIYLLRKSGLNDGVYADVDHQGAFDFGQVPVGEYQVRYWGGNLADVPEIYPNPVRITVAANTPSVVKFTITVGAPEDAGIEIYAGDDFYQLQPFGAVNGTYTVPVGTLVCWYNVGVSPHTVTGGPWRDSGVLNEADNFMWLADKPGDFPFQCRFHGPGMQALLRVTA